MHKHVCFIDFTLYFYFIFGLNYALYFQHTKPSAGCESSEPYREYFGQRVLVKCVSLRFRLQAPLTDDKEVLTQVMELLRVHIRNFIFYSFYSLF